jgi:hypothetical protein
MAGVSTIRAMQQQARQAGLGVTDGIHHCSRPALPLGPEERALTTNLSRRKCAHWHSNVLCVVRAMCCSRLESQMEAYYLSNTAVLWQ